MSDYQDILVVNFVRNLIGSPVVIRQALFRAPGPREAMERAACAWCAPMLSGRELRPTAAGFFALCPPGRDPALSDPAFAAFSLPALLSGCSLFGDANPFVEIMRLLARPSKLARMEENAQCLSKRERATHDIVVAAIEAGPTASTDPTLREWLLSPCSPPAAGRIRSRSDRHRRETDMTT